MLNDPLTLPFFSLIRREQIYWVDKRTAADCESERADCQPSILCVYCRVQLLDCCPSLLTAADRPAVWLKLFDRRAAAQLRQAGKTKGLTSLEGKRVTRCLHVRVFG